MVASVSKPFTDLWEDIVEVGPRWLVALAVLVISWLLARLVRVLVQKAISRTSTQGHVDLLVARAAAGLVILVGILVALSEVGMSFSAALAAFGLASVGIGFALQDVLANFFAGVILLMQHPFTIGDQIKVGAQEGVVENIRVRDTQVLTYAGERVFIPNKTVFDSPIINFSSTPTLRADLRVQLACDADAAATMKAAIEVLSCTDGVLEQPPPSVLLDVDEDATVLVLRFWTDSDRNYEMKVKSALLEALAGIAAGNEGPAA